MADGMRLRKYGVEATIDFELYEVDGVNLRVDWVPAAADCEIMKDGGVSTGCTNTAVDEGSTYSIVLTATEMQAARLVLKVVDAATKVFLDTVVVIETYGNASAQHAIDLDTASVAQTADHTAGIADIPTVAEFNARSLASADYTIVADLGVVQTADHTAGIADVPTVAEFNARTLLAADYVITTDTIAGVTAVTNDVGITQAGADKVWGTAARALTDKADFALSAASRAALWDETEAITGNTHSFETILARLYRYFMNDQNIVDATGVQSIRNEANGADIASRTITDDDTTTNSTDVVWP